MKIMTQVVQCPEGIGQQWIEDRIGKDIEKSRLSIHTL